MEKNKRKTKSKDFVSMPLINPNAAGIDVGDTTFAVAVPAGRDSVQVKEFTAFTCDLKSISQWLSQCCIETVAMESTGVYWKQIFSVLVKDGFEVYLVNAKHVKNVTGKKDDQSDAMWIQQLHSCGLLRSCFLPDEHTESLRTLVRFRRNLINDSSRYILRMQKSLELMNIKVHTVINDITGKTGTAIIEAIINGERDPKKFMPYVDKRIKASKETLLKSLEGNWRKEHLATLKLSYELYMILQQKVVECEKQIEQILSEYSNQNATDENKGEINLNSETNSNLHNTEKKNSLPDKATKKKQKTKSSPVFEVDSYLKRIYGVDVTQIYGISQSSALEILAETGTDLRQWENEDKWVSWLNLCPHNKQSGGKLISSTRLKKKPNLATQAFRSAANSLCRSDHWLGDYFRRMRAKGGQKYAIVATARKLAIIYYRMIRNKEEFNPVDLKEYQKQYKAAKISYLERKLEELKRAA
ncbi:MAG: IS110 family transposase [Bacteroidota bacterium]|nr:IS110 family transposase [Bacteroidota bacterium]MDQ3021954.1 IS110 family transposase [Bacteroidota bacterium]